MKIIIENAKGFRIEKREASCAPSSGSASWLESRWLTAFIKLSAVCWLLDLTKDITLLHGIVSASIAYVLLAMSERK